MEENGQKSAASRNFFNILNYAWKIYLFYNYRDSGIPFG